MSLKNNPRYLSFIYNKIKRISKEKYKINLNNYDILQIINTDKHINNVDKSIDTYINFINKNNKPSVNKPSVNKTSVNKPPVNKPPVNKPPVNKPPVNKQPEKFYSICFVSSMFANNIKDGDKPTYFRKDNRYSYKLFTNLEPNNFNTSWDVVKVKDENEIDKCKKNVTKSRYHKFMGWKYIKEKLKKNYDVIIYCDAILYPKTNVDWQTLAKIVVKSDNGILQSLHRRNPYQECNVIVKNKKDNKHNMDKTSNFLRKNNLPYNIRMPENTAFIYNPNNKKLQNTMTEFWNMYSKEELSHRDQPLWAYYLWKNKLNPTYYNIHNINKSIHGTLFMHIKNFGFNGHRYV